MKTTVLKSNALSELVPALLLLLMTMSLWS
jgi:hypothetical protein